jgi:hypothetical protein
MTDVVPQARKLLAIMKDVPQDTPGFADELILFFEHLRDEYDIAQSKSPRLSGRTFDPLNPILYNLESNPDRVLAGGAEKDFLTGILEDLVSGRILVRKKNL